MKTLHYIALLFLTLSFSMSYGQKTVVTANNYDISDNLDLQAVASIFGESSDLADFEFRLNDPYLRINNLDLNGDGYVDYLRVVEVIEDRTHLIVIQAVLGKDLFQDVATIEVERDKRKKVVYMQVVGNSYLYGANYIYEPVYVSTPPMFSLFWGVSYRPYHSSWYWNYYPDYYYGYAPYSTGRYASHVHVHINQSNNYFYRPYRYSSRAERMYPNVRQDYYERQNPNNSFRTRYGDDNFYNRNDLTRSRSSRSEYATSRSSNYNRGNSRSEYSSNGNSDYKRGNSRSDYSSSGSNNYDRGSSRSEYATSGNRSVNKVDANSNSSNSRSSYSTGNSVSSSNYNRGTSSSSNANSSSNNSSSSRSNYSSSSNRSYSTSPSSSSSSSSRQSYSRSSSSPSSSASSSSSTRSSSNYGSSSSGSSRSSYSTQPSSTTSSSTSRSSSSSSRSSYSR